MTEPRIVKVSDTGRGRDPKNPLCSLDDFETDYKLLLISIIGKMSEWSQRKRDDGRDHFSVMTSLDVGETIGLGKGYTKHNTRDKGAGKKRNSIGSVVMGQLYNYENNKIKYPTGASVSWNQLQDFEIIMTQMAGAFPDDYEPVKFVISAFDWNPK